MDSRIVKHFEEELEKLNVELRPFDKAVDKALDADKAADDKDLALKKARDSRDDVKAALVFAEEKVALAEKELKEALDFADACKKEVVALKDDDKLAKRDEFLDILDELKAEPEEDQPHFDEPVVEDEPIIEPDAVCEPPVCDECVIDVEVKDEPIVEEKPADEPKAEAEHKAVFDSLMKKRHITIK